MICWNEGCNIDIIRGENWTPQNKIWIETATDRPHNFKQCFKQPYTKNGNWVIPKKKYEKVGDPIIDDANKHYYPQLKYFLTHGRPTHGYYGLEWLKK